MITKTVINKSDVPTVRVELRKPMREHANEMFGGIFRDEELELLVEHLVDELFDLYYEVES